MITTWDTALDGVHIGPKSHKQIARRMDKFLPKF